MRGSYGHERVTHHPCNICIGNGRWYTWNPFNKGSIKRKLREIRKTCVHWCTIFSNINIARAKNLISKSPVYCYRVSYFDARIKAGIFASWRKWENARVAFRDSVGSTRQRVEPTFIQLLFLSLSVRGLLPSRHSCYWLFLHLFRSRKPGKKSMRFCRQQ